MLEIDAASGKVVDKLPIPWAHGVVHTATGLYVLASNLGKVVKLEWVNPHAWIHIEVAKPDGAKEVWMVEGGTPNTLLRRGLTRESLTVGTELVVDGYQTKDHSLKRANGRDVTFTDGRKMFMGSSGTGAPRDGRDPTEPGTKKPGGR